MKLKYGLGRTTSIGHIQMGSLSDACSITQELLYHFGVTIEAGYVERSPATYISSMECEWSTG